MVYLEFLILNMVQFSLVLLIQAYMNTGLAKKYALELMKTKCVTILLQWGDNLMNHNYNFDKHQQCLILSVSKLVTAVHLFTSNLHIISLMFIKCKSLYEINPNSIKVWLKSCLEWRPFMFKNILNYAPFSINLLAGNDAQMPCPLLIILFQLKVHKHTEINISATSDSL